MLKPIVSMCGDAEAHRRADAYNRALATVEEGRETLQDVLHWNRHERFGTGFFAQTKPPIDASRMIMLQMQAESQLAAERAEIVRLSGGTVKP